jgi:hypothetical protein
MSNAFAAAVVLSVLIVVVGSVIGTVMNARLRAKSGLRKDWLGNEVPIENVDAAARQRELEELRERVKVLERIATDKSVHLADQIEDLRGEKR